MRGALDGIRIVEWGIMHHGVAAGAWLGDLGAEVIKIEEPGKGDPLRRMEELSGHATPTAQQSTYFGLANRNKRSITLDLHKAQGREIAYRLVSKAHVFCTNFRENVLRRSGMDYETLREYNPRLVYASATAFGLSGPLAGRRGFDYTGQALSGMMMELGQGEPDFMIGAPIDQEGSTLFAYGLLAALLAQERQGIGQMLDVSLVGSAIWLQGCNVNTTLRRGRPMVKHRRDNAPNPLVNYYRCQDGKWIFLHEMYPDKYWQDLCEIGGLEPLLNDERFADVVRRRANRKDVIAVLDEAFSAKTREEWVAILDQVGLAYCPINSMTDLADDPQALENRYVVEYDDPSAGRVKTLGFPVQFTQTPGAIHRPPPSLGEHTEEVLAEFGYTVEEIGALRAAQVI